MRRIRVIAAAVAAAAAGAGALAALAALPGSPAVGTVHTLNLYVNPARGSDAAAGTETAPLRTIQQAMDKARPGTVIHLAAGSYNENVTTRVSGLPGARIVVEGPASGTATLFGTDHVMAIRDSYYTLRDFAIDGQRQVESRYPRSAWPTQMSRIREFKGSFFYMVR